MPNYMNKINKDKEVPEKEEIVSLTELTEKQKNMLKVKHYTLNLPNTLHPTQLQSIRDMARSIMNNEPFVNIHLDGLKNLLRYVMLYRNILFEFDEDIRWKPSDELFFNELTEEFKPLVETVQKESRIEVRRLDEI